MRIHFRSEGEVLQEGVNVNSSIHHHYVAILRTEGKNAYLTRIVIPKYDTSDYGCEESVYELVRRIWERLQ